LANFELSLNGSWKFKGFAECNGEELRAYKLEYDDDGWLPAKVPGTVHLDLLANNVIPDPFKGLNEKKVPLLNLQKKEAEAKDKEEEERAKSIEGYSKKVRPRFLRVKKLIFAQSTQ
jgi:hypothetical protein